MIELEKTYLAKKLPEGLRGCEFKEIIDIYIPRSQRHPKLRIRKNGNEYRITKKGSVEDGDRSRMREQTIKLTRVEFGELSKLEGKRIRKLRYLYEYKGRTAEVDIFQDALEGLVVVDFEFATIKEKESFKMPDFCLVDVTQEEFIAGGIVCGKGYEDIERYLQKFNYQKLFLK